MVSDSEPAGPFPSDSGRTSGQEEGQGAGAEPADAKPASGKQRLLLKRIALALGSLLFTLLLLELVAAVVTPDPRPVLLRDGVYVNTLPLVTGRSHFGMRPPEERPPLPQEKREGEFRILVFGESSVEGQPLHHEASAPTMLYDELKLRFPDRDITVVNMGRTGSIIANVYYYLLISKDFEPDAIIFYFGGNDSSELGGEQCWSIEHPNLHGMWRFVVERSALAKALRIYAPQLLWAGQAGTSGQGRTCEAMEVFPTWADRVVALASEIAPVVIVTTPVLSMVGNLERNGFGLYENLETPIYRELVRCRLDRQCDFYGEMRRILTGVTWYEVVSNSFFPSVIPLLHRVVALRVEWAAAAKAHGAIMVDFLQALSDVSPGGLPGVKRDQFADEIHLTMQGYLFLARHWAEALRPALGGGTALPVAFPKPSEVMRYSKDLKDKGYSSLFNYIRRGWLLVTLDGFTQLLRFPVAGRPSTLAAVFLAWARERVGLAPQQHAGLQKCLETFDPMALSDEQLDDNRWECGLGSLRGSFGAVAPTQPPQPSPR